VTVASQGLFSHSFWWASHTHTHKHCMKLVNNIQNKIHPLSMYMSNQSFSIAQGSERLSWGKESSPDKRRM